MEERERQLWATILIIALRRSHPEDVEAAIEAELGVGGAGVPIAPFDEVLPEARLWAEWATPDELAAYALATVEAMEPVVRVKFLGYAARRFAVTLRARRSRPAGTARSAGSPGSSISPTASAT